MPPRRNNRIGRVNQSERWTRHERKTNRIGRMFVTVNNLSFGRVTDLKSGRVTSLRMRLKRRSSWRRPFVRGVLWDVVRRTQSRWRYGNQRLNHRFLRRVKGSQIVTPQTSIIERVTNLKDGRVAYVKIKIFSSVFVYNSASFVVLTDFHAGELI